MLPLTFMLVASTLASTLGAECELGATHCEFWLEIQERITMENEDGEYVARKGKLYRKGENYATAKPVC